MYRRREQIITPSYCKEHLELWIQADAAVATGQSYKIGKRELTRAHASEIRKMIDYWQDRYNTAVDEEENGRIGVKSRSITRMVPRDL